jgi:protein SCO1/2
LLSAAGNDAADDLPEVMFTKRQMAVIYVAATLTVAFAGAATWLEMMPQQKQPQNFWQVPAFALTNQDGQRVTMDDLTGKVWLADFVYTTCPGSCPMITEHMALLQGKLPAGVRQVSFSTDPENDSPAVLKAYAEKFGAGPQWTFLTGPKTAIYDLIEHGFKLPIQTPPGAQIIHSTRIALVDKRGMVRGFYDGTDYGSDEQILADLRKVMNE